MVCEEAGAEDQGVVAGMSSVQGEEAEALLLSPCVHEGGGCQSGNKADRLGEGASS